MLGADHPFKHPVDPAILFQLRELFADAAAKHPPITFTSITSIKPWPMIGVNVPELLDAMVRHMGRGERPCIPAHNSPSMGPPYEFFFAQRDALDCYKELARRVGEQTPLGPYKDWTYILHQLALSQDVVSFRAPARRLHCYPCGPGKGWQWVEEHQAPEYWHSVAVVCYWQLADLWTASAEALTRWSKQGTGAAGTELPGENPNAKEPPTIWYHGDKSYSINGENPVHVSNEQHNVLKAFLDKNIALDTQNLQNAGVNNPSAVIAKIAKKFGEDAIQSPKQKGEGYFIRVRFRATGK